MENTQEPENKKKPQPTLFADQLFRFAAKHYPQIVEIILQAVLEKPTLKLQGDPIPQADFKSLSGRSVIADVYAIEEDGSHSIIELHNNIVMDEMELKAELESAILASYAVEAGTDYKNPAHRSRIPSQYTVFLCRGDILGYGLPYYDAERCWVNVEGKPLFHGKAHIRVVNGAYRGPDAIGILMHDLCEELPENQQDSRISDIFSKILERLSNISISKENPMEMDEESRELYDYLFGEEKKSLMEKLAAKDATIDAQATALSTAKEELARYKAKFGPLPSQQSPAAPQA